ncbi:hypothetical protein NQ315_003293 [Exocentrus adspersus]|uniref:Regulatory protein zeste n=1 Tax=Exocentrus adspersus TaxID=1586481 RepID=A0AAV8VAH5_9CUCU|nr:hypothetical protein NQ315_003293 [Exocentrus adspersus]
MLSACSLALRAFRHFHKSRTFGFSLKYFFVTKWNAIPRKWQYYREWRQITSDPVILSWVKGYQLPVIRKIKQSNFCSENSWSPEDKESIVKEIAHLLDIGAISVSPIFLISKPNGKRRLILNLKNLNTFLNTDHFKMEDRNTVTKLLFPGAFMASIDLKDVYFLINVHEKDRKYLRFQFNNRLSEYTCIPFGLCSAPLVFTKLMKQVLYWLRRNQFTSVAYLDDFLLIGNSYVDCLNNVNITLGVLHRLGFVINTEKSNLIRNRRCAFLGKVTVVCPAVKYGWLHVKQFERAKYSALIKAKGAYKKTMTIPTFINNDLTWWKSKILTSFNSIEQSRKYVIEIFSDAALQGWGAFCNGLRANGQWNASEQSYHINKLELLAAHFALKCFANDLQDCDILLRIDNTTAVAYINRMGGLNTLGLNSITEEIWNWCEDRNFLIHASYIRSKDNVEADKESRKVSLDIEYELCQSQFNLIVCSNVKIKRFFRGTQNLRPNAPKYDAVWDPTTVLTYLGKLFPNESLSLKELSLKLVTLFALVTAHGHRLCRLLILVTFIKMMSDSEIFISDKIKKSNKNNTRPVLYIPFYKDNPAICAAKTLETYLSKTAPLREKKAQLFIAFKKPHKPVSSQTLSRWIKTMLKNCGIDTERFTGHSCRHASTSSANRKGSYYRRFACLMSFLLLSSFSKWTIVDKHKSIVENKKTDATTIQSKQKEWEIIAFEYNSQADIITTKRTAAQLKKLWNNLKQKKRKTNTDEKYTRLLTGGGPPIEFEKDPVMDAVDIAAPHADVTLSCTWDSTATHIYEGEWHFRMDVRDATYACEVPHQSGLTFRSKNSRGDPNSIAFV